jgi:hypothetical protein
MNHGTDAIDDPYVASGLKMKQDRWPHSMHLACETWRDRGWVIEVKEVNGQKNTALSFFNGFGNIGSPVDRSAFACLQSARVSSSLLGKRARQVVGLLVLIACSRLIASRGGAGACTSGSTSSSTQMSPVRFRRPKVSCTRGCHLRRRLDAHRAVCRPP